MSVNKQDTDFSLEDAIKILIELLRGVPSLEDTMFMESEAVLKMVSGKFKFDVEFTNETSSLIVRRREDGARVIALKWQSIDHSVMDLSKTHALAELVDVLAFGRMHGGFQSQ